MFKDKGYFCVIRYFNDRTRLEHINVGIMIYSENEGKLFYELIRDETFAKLKFFYPTINMDFANSTFDEFELIVKEVNANHTTIEDIENKLNDFLKYKLRIEPFRRIMLDELADDFKHLYASFVCNPQELELWESRK